MPASLIPRRRTFNIIIALLFLLVIWHVIERARPISSTGWLYRPRPAAEPVYDGPLEVDHVGKTDTFNWAKLPQRYPVKKLTPVPANPGREKIPKIQALFFPKKNELALKTQEDRMKAVKDEFLHAWRAYRYKAWKKDELRPISGEAQDPFGGWGATMVDAMGTLWIMGLEREFDESVGAANSIDLSSCALEELNVFETTIRYLGGLLSAYDLSKGKYPSLKDKAVELGEMLYHAFDTPNRMPITRWKWEAAMKGQKQEASDFMLVAEIGSLSLEFTRLSQVTGDPKYYDAIQRITELFAAQQNRTNLPGMWPVVVDAKNKDLTSSYVFTVGGMADSAFEYLPKQHQLLNGADPTYESMYKTTLETMKEHIFYRPMTSDNRDILLAGQVQSESWPPKTPLQVEPGAQHLACFTGGMVGLGARLFSSPDDITIARKLVDGCLWAYETNTLGIMPEIMHTVACPDAKDCTWQEATWHEAVLNKHPSDVELGLTAPEIIARDHLPPGVSRIDDTRYILRPEAIESVFYLYRLTGDAALQDKAWNMFVAIVSNTRTEWANAALDDCTVPEAPKDDRMESFWLAETLRYFYLIFADEELVSLDEWVLNTEAHPLKRPP